MINNIKIYLKNNKKYEYFKVNNKILKKLIIKIILNMNILIKKVKNICIVI